MTLSGKQLAAVNAKRFNDWIADREAAEDWMNYIRIGKLNRTQIAGECQFALTVFRQNPAIKSALVALEARLRDSDVLPDAKAARKDAKAVIEATALASDHRLQSQLAAAYHRIKQLEEQNAVQKVEIKSLRESLTKFKHLDQHLSTTGRLLHP
ncbi:MAG: VPA1267 family protein [Sulfuritalea sp.]|nr:VPA1267 family protein [Sulfuritalea sp.]